MSSTIAFYFDFSSPYGYFAAAQADELERRTGRAVEWKSIMVGTAFKASGNKPLVDQPLKGAYSRHDWERMARLLKVPYGLPERFPIPTLAPSRAFWWLSESDPAQAKAYAKAVYHAYFAEGRDISDPAVAAGIGGQLGVDADVLALAMQDETWKQRLRAETEAAIAAGVFGSPFFVVDGEGFWGADRMTMVEDWVLRGGW